jgi:uncharacterized protein
MISLPSMSLGLLIFFSLFTSALSSATGLGGGVLLFTLMTFYFPIGITIPIHGLIQFVNNFITLIFLRKFFIKGLLLPFILGSVPGILIGAWWVEKIINSNIPQLIILILIFYVLFRPQKLPDLELKYQNFFWVGLMTGVLGILAGIIDPVIAPFYMRKDLSKEEIIANKAAMQAFIHLSKIPVFLYLGFDYAPYLGLCLLTNLASLVGTRLGISVLKKIGQNIFHKIFKFALLATGLRLLYKILI